MKKPARKNLMPAKRICDDVSLPAIFRKLYPILITGNALPHDDGHKAEVAAGDGFAQGIFTQFGITVDDEADGVRDGGFGSTTK